MTKYQIQWRDDNGIWYPSATFPFCEPAFAELNRLRQFELGENYRLVEIIERVLG